MLRNRWWKTIRTAAMVALTTAFLAACGGGDTVAVYKNMPDGSERKVTQKQFDKFLDISMFLNPTYSLYAELPAFQQDMLRQYIGFQVLGSRLSGEAAKEAENQAKEEVRAFRDAYGTTVEEALKEAKLDFDDLEAYVALYSKAMNYLETQIAEEEIRELFDSTLAEDPNAYTTATVSHILIRTNEERSSEEALKLANEVRDKLLGGADFAELAAEYSDDTYSAQNGGTLTDYVNAWVEGFRNAVLTLPLDQISEPVETEYGYHIIKVSERNVPTYDDMKETLRSQLIAQKFGDFMETELDALIVENNLPAEDESTDESTDGDAAGDESEAGDAGAGEAAN
jgi:foldase protein PrsA